MNLKTRNSPKKQTVSLITSHPQISTACHVCTGTSYNILSFLLHFKNTTTCRFLVLIQYSANMSFSFPCIYMYILGRNMLTATGLFIFHTLFLNSISRPPNHIDQWLYYESRPWSAQHNNYTYLQVKIQGERKHRPSVMQDPIIYKVTCMLQSFGHILHT